MKLLSALVIASMMLPVEAQDSLGGVRDSKGLLPAVARAIEDELYDLRQEGLYFQIDGNSGGDNSPAQISMYVSKGLAPNGTGVVIYKHMPYGEVYRYFKAKADGIVELSGDPMSKFPPHGGSMLTVYMTHEEVCDFIQNKAYKAKFTINPRASSQRIRDAEDNQQRRTGYSFRLKKGSQHK